MTVASSKEMEAVTATMLDRTAFQSAEALAAGGERAFIDALEEVLAQPVERFVSIVSTATGLEPLTMIDLQAAPPAFDIKPFTECSMRGIAMQRTTDGSPRIGLADPFDDDLVRWALRAVGPRGKVAVAHRADIAAWLAQQEEALRAMQSIVADTGADIDDAQNTLELSLTSISEDISAVVRLVNSTLYDAIKLQASDIHLECDANALVIKMRIDGVLATVGEVRGAEVAEQVVSRVKVLAELDIAERRIPQDGRFKARIRGQEVDFRVSVMPNIFGEDAVLRLLDRRALVHEQALRLESLGLDETVIAGVRRLAGKPHGMLLVTGPTGSGKTTTLYAAITEINSGRDKIVTIEDPVEYRLAGVLQIPVNEKKGLTFARGLRSILRHDPDKIMVGEIRDPETAQIAIQAALTGHLVLTTVHANNVFDVLGRFLHMGVDPYSFVSALNGILAQRLLRKICTHCSEPLVPGLAELQEAGLTTSEHSTWQWRCGRGCGVCRGTGFKGRLAVAELLVLDDELRELISSKAPVSALKEAASKRGVQSLRVAALRHVAAGVTTLAEVQRVAQ
jgi:general secretion pathway protein E